MYDTLVALLVVGVIYIIGGVSVGLLFNTMFETFKPYIGIVMSIIYVIAVTLVFSIAAAHIDRYRQVEHV